jgi:hypothetical protein
MGREGKPISGSQPGRVRLLALVLGLVALIEGAFLFLDRWETTAEHLGIPGPRTVKEIVAGKPPALNMFGSNVFSKMDAVEVLEPPTRLPPGCSESASVRMSMPLEDLGEAEPADVPIWRSEMPLFVHADSTFTVDGLKIGPSKQTAPTVHLSLLVSNSGRYGSVVMNTVELEVERIGAVEPTRLALQAFWRRWHVTYPTPIPPPPTGIPPLSLEGALTGPSGQVEVVLSETRTRRLSFELKADEKIDFDVALTLDEPGMYRVTPIVDAFRSDGKLFQQYGPSMSFGWTALSSGPFGGQSLIPTHSAECK